MSEVLVLYYSRYGATEALAREICQGVDSVDGMSARLRTVPAVSSVTEASADSIAATAIITVVVVAMYIWLENMRPRTKKTRQ